MKLKMESKIDWITLLQVIVLNFIGLWTVTDWFLILIRWWIAEGVGP